MRERAFKGDAAALSSEEKVLIVNAWRLLDETRERSSLVRGMDMTWRMQLRSDCKALEKALKETEKNPGHAQTEKLQRAYLALQTSAEHILGLAEEDDG